MSRKNGQKKVALLIDAANCRNVDFEQMLRIARRHGELVITRAYGNFSSHRYLGKMAEKLFLLGVQLIHCPAWKNGSSELKSTADEVLMNDVHALMRTRRSVTRFIICSGDGHYIPTICEIKKRGKEAIVMANPEVASRLIMEVADKFIPLPPVAAPVPTEIFHALVEAVRTLQKAQSRTAVPSRAVKPKMIQLRGEFDEKKYHGQRGRPFRSFIEFLKEAESEGWVHLVRQNGNTWVSTITDPVPEAVFQALNQAVSGLQQEQRTDAVSRSSVKQKMIDLLGEFDEMKYRDRRGRQFLKFTEFLEEAEFAGWIRLIQRDGDTLVTTTADRSQAA